jgi:hypothetical protein
MKKILGITVLLLFLAGPALAITAPTTTGFAYTMYDIVVVKMLQGAIGFIAGLALVIWGASMLPRAAYLPAAFTVAAGGMIIKADTIVTSLGMLI